MVQGEKKEFGPAMPVDRATENSARLAAHAREGQPAGSTGSLQIKAFIVLCALVTIGLLGRWRLLADDSEADASRPSDQPLRIVMRAAPNFADAASIDQLVERLQKYEVQEVLLQLKQDESHEFLGGTVFYPSEIAPIAPGFGDDRMGRFIQTASSIGIRVFAWLPCLHDPHAAAGHPDWRAWWINNDGVAEDQVHWLCPRSEQAIAYEASLAAEVVGRYPDLAGLYTDFIRYDSDLSCVCPRCMSELGRRVAESAALDATTEAQPMCIEDVVHAGRRHDHVWRTWIDFRAESICDAVETMRDSIDRVRPDTWFGACVLPFSAADYSLNTQSGQDFYELARVGLDEIVLMGYWDDWGKSPEWLEDSLRKARELVDGEAKLSCLLDGDMSVRRTCVTLDAIDRQPVEFGFFNYGPWSEETFGRLSRSIDLLESDDRLVGSSATAVVIRVDTEPDWQLNYEAVSPGMVHDLMNLFESEGVRGTFITCGRLAELQGEVIREAARRGHEIGVHAYNHEQIDSLPEDEQIAVVNKSLQTFKTLDIAVNGFAAPRNSITGTARDALIDAGLAYDGSAAFDPASGYVDAAYAEHSDGSGRRILVIPFVIPNDWDSRYLAHESAATMLEHWKDRLDRLIALKEPCFVLDIHQWIASQPENREAVRAFIRYAKSNERCRMMTLRDAARHTARVIERTELSTHAPSPASAESRGASTSAAMAEGTS